jgi:CopG family transcriptional regulator / antitoxin EndoAI
MATPRTFTISLPPKLARQVDKVAKQEGRTRSELFREAVRQYIAKEERWQQLFAYAEEEARKRGLTEADVDRAVEEYRHGRR